MTNRYHVGGTVSGLAGTGLVLQDNGGDDLTITAGGAFTFPTTVASGATFTVSIKAQPTGPAQTCQLSSASGTIGTSDVTGVVVNCADQLVHRRWDGQWPRSARASSCRTTAATISR